MSELIAKLEAASGPSRAIDAVIFSAIGLTEKQERHCKDWCRMDARTDLTRNDYILAWAPTYTRSIDDALTLLPEGLNWSLNNKCEARVGGPVAGFTIKGGTHKYPAIALCIAALKARANSPSPAVLPQGGES